MKKNGYEALLEKADIAKIEAVCELPESVKAPVKAGDVIGKVTYKCGETVLGTADIVAAEDAEKMGFFTLFVRILRYMVCSPEN